jgi:hypothetical protein
MRGIRRDVGAERAVPRARTHVKWITIKFAPRANLI